jgi:hypothetical protein
MVRLRLCCALSEVGVVLLLFLLLPLPILKPELLLPVWVALLRPWPIRVPLPMLMLWPMLLLLPWPMPILVLSPLPIARQTPSSPSADLPQILGPLPYPSDPMPPQMSTKRLWQRMPFAHPRCGSPSANQIIFSKKEQVNWSCQKDADHSPLPVSGPSSQP